MKIKTLPTKRKAVTKGVFRKLQAVTQGRRRKQRAATTTNARDFEDGQASARIGRALFVILLIHVLAVAMIFVHHQFLSDRSMGEDVASKPTVHTKMVPATSPQPVPASGVIHSQMAPDETPYIVSQGESYSSIAAAHQISEEDLRELNGNAAIRPGYLLKIPVKRVVIKTPQSQQTAQLVMVKPRQPASQSTTPIAASPIPARDQGLVEAVDTQNAPRAVPVNTNSGGKYIVKKGDTVWGIASRHGVNQTKLMEVNGISDPRKLRLGMSLIIP